jgi:glycosyltransferase involved in cell wall biosynthesis
MNISVIVPCYNTGNTVLETMASLEIQTFRAFEVIFINDGSTDETLLLLEDFARNTKLDVRIVNQENQGVSSARNRGIAEAKNDYLVFLDADDIWEPRFLEYMAASTASGADVSYCMYTRDLNEIKSSPPFVPEYKTVSLDHAMRDLLYHMNRYSFFCYLYRKRTIQTYQLLFDEATKFGEDREYIWKYLCHMENAVKIDYPLYGYRKNSLSATSTYSGWRKTDLLQAVKRVECYMEKMKHPFSGEFEDYMYPRAMWATAKTFAIHNGKPEFMRLIQQYDVRSCMQRMLHDSSKKVRIMAWLYLANPQLFFTAGKHTPSIYAG